MNAIAKSLVVAAMGAGTVVLCLKSPATVEGDNAGVTMKLPARVLHLWGKKDEVSEAERTILPEDTEFAKMIYRGIAPDGTEDWVGATIVLSANDRRSLHRPEVCLPGQGWTIGAKEVVPIVLESGGELKVMKLDLSREQEIAKGRTITLRAVYLYWYVGRDVTTPSTEWRVLLSVRDNIFRNINHRWAYVSLISIVGEGLQENGRNSEETLALLGDFVRASVGEFQKTF